MTTFSRLANTITSDASRYATRRACELAIARLKAEWTRAGSYGVDRDQLVSAIAECQYRWLELKTAA